MKVKELKQILSELDQDADVFIGDTSLIEIKKGRYSLNGVLTDDVYYDILTIGKQILVL